MAAGAAPELPALGAILASAFLALAWVTCLGVLWAYRRSLKLVILGFANIIDVSVLGRHPLGHVAGWLRAQAKNIDHLLGEAALASERGAVVLFKLFLNIQVWLAHEVADLATDVWHALGHVERVTVTRVTKVVTHTVVKPLTTRVTIVKGTSAAVAKQIAAQAHALGARVSRLEHALGHAVATPFPRIGRLERDVANQSKRLRKAEKALAAGASAALVLTALKRLGIGWIRCGNVTKVGKRLCGLDPGLLEALLGATVLLTSGISLRDLARELEEPTKIARDGLRLLIDEL